MAEIKILIVEDNPLFAIEIETIVNQLGHVKTQIISSIEAAIEFIELQLPDLLLLSLKAREQLSGLETLAELKDYGVPIIFLCEQKDEVIYEKAKLLEPYGFIFKPYEKLTLRSTIEMALFHKSRPFLTSGMAQAWKENLLVKEVLFVKRNNKLFKVHLLDILVIEAEGNYSILNTLHKKFAIKTSLKQLKQKLSPRLFIQIHRNYIVQIPHVDTVDITSGEVQVNNKNYPIGGKFKHRFIGRLNQI